MSGPLHHPIDRHGDARGPVFLAHAGGYCFLEMGEENIPKQAGGGGLG